MMNWLIFGCFGSRQLFGSVQQQWCILARDDRIWQIIYDKKFLKEKIPPLKDCYLGFVEKKLEPQGIVINLGTVVSKFGFVGPKQNVHEQPSVIGKKKRQILPTNFEGKSVTCPKNWVHRSWHTLLHVLPHPQRPCTQLVRCQNSHQSHAHVPWKSQKISHHHCQTPGYSWTNNSADVQS